MPLLLRRPALKARLVSCHSREVLPDPTESVFALLETGELVGGHSLEGFQFGGGLGFICGHPAGADEEDIAEVDACVLEGETGEEVAEGDCGCGERVEGGVLRGGLGEPPGVVVD